MPLTVSRATLLCLPTVLSAGKLKGYPVLGCGDTVSTPYGDGLVLSQRDTDAMTAVKLQWGAVAFLAPDCVTLLLRADQVPSRRRGVLGVVCSPHPHPSTCRRSQWLWWMPASRARLCWSATACAAWHRCRPA